MSIIKDDDCKSGKGICPVFLTLGLIANKWGIVIIANLLNSQTGSLRFTELQKSINGITQAELSKQLKEFSSCGIVTRKSYNQIPPKVEYALTELGKSLWTPIQSLSQWAQENGEKVIKNKSAYKNPKENEDC